MVNENNVVVKLNFSLTFAWHKMADVTIPCIFRVKVCVK